MLTETRPSCDTDVWSEWLLHYRQADDEDYGKAVQAAVAEYADRVLAGAQLEPGMTLVDVGSGEGLIAFRAIGRIGESLNVILTDISAPMLRYAENAARERGCVDQCTFIECPADDLSSIPTASVDVVTTRSVLAYVQDKPAALREFYRILKPGGRISIAEPILQDEALYARVLRMRVEAPSAQPPDRFLELLHRWKAAQFPDTEEVCLKSSHVNYTERILFRNVVDSGFAEGHMELHINSKRAQITLWKQFIGCSPHPWAPPLSFILAEKFSAEERQLFEQVLRPSIESGEHISTDRMVYITGRKPGFDTKHAAN